MVKIEKNIALPMGKQRPSKLMKNLEKMKVGDSFLFSSKSRTRLDKIFRNLGFKYTARKVSECRIRVWRIK